MKMSQFEPPSPPRPSLQERLQQVIGAQVIQIVSLQAQVDELQQELAKLRPPMPSVPKGTMSQTGSE